MVVTVIAALTDSSAEPVTNRSGPLHSLVSTPDLPSPDAQPGTIPGAAEPEDDQALPADVGVPARRPYAPAAEPARLARLIHALFAAPRSVPLRA